MKNNCKIYEGPFNICVVLLQKMAEFIHPYWPGGMDYKKLNVILFCIILPAAMGISIALNVILLAML